MDTTRSVPYTVLCQSSVSWMLITTKENQTAAPYSALFEKHSFPSIKNLIPNTPSMLAVRSNSIVSTNTFENIFIYHKTNLLKNYIWVYIVRAIVST